jgi:IS30 family transposase
MMVYRKRINYTTEKMSLIWDCWKKGQSLRSIGRIFERNSNSIYGLISRTGGIRPPQRCRSKHSLVLSEREEISRGIALQLSLRTIAAKLGRSPSTISREIRRNGGLASYRATQAEDAAWQRSCRPKLCKSASAPKLCKIIGDKLKDKWSPEQISGWLKQKYPNNKDNHVSYETIYKSLFIQSRGVLKKELAQYLRSKRTIRRSKHSTMKGNGLGQINDAISIHERPASVDDRAIPGHWEGDLI